MHVLVLTSFGEHGMGVVSRVRGVEVYMIYERIVSNACSNEAKLDPPPVTVQ